MLKLPAGYSAGSPRIFFYFYSLKSPFLGFRVIQTGYWPDFILQSVFIIKNIFIMKNVIDFRKTVWIHAWAGSTQSRRDNQSMRERCFRQSAHVHTLLARAKESSFFFSYIKSLTKVDSTVILGTERFCFCFCFSDGWQNTLIVFWSPKDLPHCLSTFKKSCCWK